MIKIIKQLEMVKVLIWGGVKNNTFYIRFSRNENERFSHQRIFFKDEEGNIDLNQNSEGNVSFFND